MEKGIDLTGIAIVYLCHDGKGNYLFSKRSSNCRDEHGTWDCGGGSLEVHESPEDTLAREILEEYCASILEFEFLGYHDVHRILGCKKTHWLALDFRVLINPEQVRNGEPHKFDDINWFRLDNLPSPLHSQLKFTIDRYRDKLI